MPYDFPNTPPSIFILAEMAQSRGSPENTQQNLTRPETTRNAIKCILLFRNQTLVRTARSYSDDITQIAQINVLIYENQIQTSAN